MIQARKLSFANYSTTETKVGKWVDGKDLYRKTYNFGSLPNATAKGINLNIPNLDKIVADESFCFYQNGVNFPLPFYSLSAPNSSVSINFTGTEIIITTGSDRSEATAYITLYYTKN